MTQKNLPDDHHAVRYVPWGKLEKDRHDMPTGRPLFSAFQLREDEDGLSVTWLEYFRGDPEQRVVRAVQAIRASNLKPSSKSGFAIGVVQSIKSDCLGRKHKIRIVHAPVKDNFAHSELRQFPRDDAELLEILARSSWSKVVLNKEITPGERKAPDAPETD